MVGTPSQAASAPLQKRLEFEQFLANVSAHLIALAPDQVDDAIQDAFEKALQFFQLDRLGLLQLLPGKKSWQIVYDIDPQGVLPYPLRTPLPISLVPWSYERLGERHETFSFADLDGLPAEADVDRRTFEQIGIRSAVFIPIAAIRSTEYSLAVSSTGSGRIPPDEYIPRLRLLGELFVNARERSRSELDLRESEQRLTLAASAAGAGFWTMNTDGYQHIWANPKVRELLALSPDEELDFERLLAAIHPGDRERVSKLFQQSVHANAAMSVEYRITRPDGTIRWIASRGSVCPAVPGAPERLMGVSMDVTARKRLESELLDRLEEIEKLKQQLHKENVYLRQEIKTVQGFEKIVGESDTLQYVLFRVRQVAPTDATVLILGETGTGKGLVANAIHELSPRRQRPMITVNCAALPGSLIESELFGREKGAFTGAHTKQIGRFEVADGGTIFLDEIGELPLELQAKLLRVLQEGEFERLGNPRTFKVDVRVIASTSRDLRSEVHEKRFREDLFYRLNVFPLTLPPLRQRAQDIPLLVRHFVDKYSRKLGRKFDSVPKSTMKALQEHVWPGNVRELEHVIERAVITSPGPALRIADGPEWEAASTGRRSSKALSDVERDHISTVLQETGWKIEGENGAASILGVHPSTLRSRIKKLQLKHP